MKIVYCHNYYRIPGGEDRVHEAETKLMQQRGHDVYVYRVHNSDIDEGRRVTNASNVIWNRKVHNELNRLTQTLKPDVVHFTNTFPVMSPAAYRAVHNNGVAVVQSLHNFRMICPGSLLLRDGKFCNQCVGKSFAWPSIVHKCYRDSASASAISAINNSVHTAIRTWQTKIDRYIALTQFSKQQFVDGGLPEKKITVKPNFVLDPPDLSNVIKSDFVLYVGRLSSEKGVDVLIDAWRNSEKKFKLLVVGCGPLESVVKQAEKESGGMIEAVGQVPHEVVMRIAADARLVAVPSVSVETFGRSVIEAYAAGTPVVASDIGSISENVIDRKTGWLVEPGNAEVLAASIQNALSDERILSIYGNAARDYFESRFTAESNYNAMMRIYQEAIEYRAKSRASSQQPAKKSVVTPSASSQHTVAPQKQKRLWIEPAIKWPRKVNLFGLGLSVTDYEQATQSIIHAAKAGRSASISCHAAHAVVTFTDREDWTEQLNRFEMITPDGQPVRWAMNLMHNVGLEDRVYGPELMLRVCQMADQEGLSVFLFGGSPNTLQLLRASLLAKFPDLQIAGAISPPFHELSEAENTDFINEINASGASILFVGLGCPKQDLFVVRNRHRLNPVQICVGAAFDFHAGVKKIAPRWMQRSGLEWVFRLLSEPRRLFARYLVTNSVFVFRFFKQLVAERGSRNKVAKVLESK